jgi:hypothetical protein
MGPTLNSFNISSPKKRKEVVKGTREKGMEIREK